MPVLDQKSSLARSAAYKLGFGDDALNIVEGIAVKMQSDIQSSGVPPILAMMVGMLYLKLVSRAANMSRKDVKDIYRDLDSCLNDIAEQWQTDLEVVHGIMKQDGRAGINPANVWQEAERASTMLVDSGTVVSEGDKVTDHKVEPPTPEQLGIIVKH